MGFNFLIVLFAIVLVVVLVIAAVVCLVKSLVNILRLVVWLVVLIAGLAGAILTALAAAGHTNSSAYGSAAAGLFVLVGLCLLCLTKLEIAKKDAPEVEKDKNE